MPKKRSRQSGPRRTPAQWIKRSVLGLAICTLGYLGVTASIAQVIASADPAKAHSLDPRNGIVTAKLAQHYFSSSPEDSNDSESARLARLALRQDPTAVEAISVLGLQAQLRNETEQTRNLFRYSLKLSRRELQPQIWAIEEAVSRGDIIGALEGYDIALRTSSRAQDILFPVLSTALAESQVRDDLLPIIATKPVWVGNFVEYLVKSSTDPASAISLLREAEGLGLNVSNEHRAALVNALAAKEGYGPAWTYYATFRRYADRNRSRDPQFTYEGNARTLFDWRTSEDPQVSAVIFASEEGGTLEFSLPATIGGMVVSQTQLLRRGNYRLEGRSSGIDQADRSRPYWVLSCRNGQELGRVEVPNSDSDGGRFQGTFTVPGACTEQILSLVARSSDTIDGVTGQITEAAVIPLPDKTAKQN